MEKIVLRNDKKNKNNKKIKYENLINSKMYQNLRIKEFDYSKSKVPRIYEHQSKSI